MKTLLLALALTLTGCGQYGEPIWLAQMYDNQDPCQSRNWKENGGHIDVDRYPRGRQSGYPEFCGGGARRSTIYTLDNRAIGYTK